MDLHYLKDNALTLGLAVGGVLAVGVGLFKFRQWVAGGVCRSKAALTGKTAIITGANTGIGLETAVDLARRGARVILACRSVERGEKAAVLVRKRSGSQDVAFVQLDLSSQDSIRAAAKSILEGETRVDILVNNAGIALGAYKTTIDGHEAHFGVNHLGHFLFTNLLLPRLVKTGSSMARVVTVTASLYKKCSRFDFEAISSSDPARYSSQMPGRAYSQSKLANILFSRGLSRRLEGAGVSTYAVHPGIVYSELSRDFIKVYPLYKRVSSTNSIQWNI